MFKSNIETVSGEENSLTSSIGSRSIVNSCWHGQSVWGRGWCGHWDLARFGWRCGGHSWGFHQLWVADWFLAARVIRICLHGASLSQLVLWTSVPETNVVLKTLETSLNTVVSSILVGYQFSWISLLSLSMKINVYWSAFSTNCLYW